MRPRFSVMTFLLVFATTSFAIDENKLIEMVAKEAKVTQEHVKQQWYDGCSSGITNRMLECSYFRRIGTDIELKETYREIMAKLETKAAKSKLRSAQRSWVAFREASCEYENLPYVGARTEGVIVAGCRTRFSKARIEQLKEYLRCESNDCTR